MKLINNTPQDVFYGINSTNPDSASCGTINAGKSAELLSYDDCTGVTVDFVPTDANGAKILDVTIPSTGTGRTVSVLWTFK